MSREQALQILRTYRNWSIDDPEIPDITIEEMAQAIDIAIEALVHLTSKPEKEYYGG